MTPVATRAREFRRAAGPALAGEVPGAEAEILAPGAISPLDPATSPIIDGLERRLNDSHATRRCPGR